MVLSAASPYYTPPLSQFWSLSCESILFYSRAAVECLGSIFEHHGRMVSRPGEALGMRLVFGSV